MVKAKTKPAARASALVLSILMLLSCFSVLTNVTANAAGNVELIADYSHGIKWQVTHSTYDPYSTNTGTHIAGSTIQKLSIKDSSGTHTVYCIQPATYVWDYGSNSEAKLSTNMNAVWQSYEETVRTDVGLAIYYGYPNPKASLTGNAADQYVATQLIIWEIVNNYRDRNTFNVYDTRYITGMCGYNYTANTNVYKSYQAIDAALKKHYQRMSFSSKDYSTAATYTLKYDSSTSKYSTTITDSNAVLTSFTLKENPSGLSLSKNGNKLTISSDKPITNTTYVKYEKELDGNGTGQVPIAYGPVYGNYSEIQSVVSASNASPIPVSAYFKVATENAGNVEIIKEFNYYANRSSNPADATTATKFTIKNSKGQYVVATKDSSNNYVFSKTGTTGTKFTLKYTGGKYNFLLTKLPPDTYTVTETDSVEGYAPKKNNQTIKVTSGTGTLTFNNYATVLRIYKDWEIPSNKEYYDYKYQAKFNIKAGNKVMKFSEGSSAGIYYYNNNGNVTALSLDLSDSKIAVYGLPADVTYTVAEIDNNDQFSKRFQVDTVGVNVKLTSTLPAQAFLTNYPQLGDITIKKNAEGTTDQQEIQNMLRQCRFVIQASDGSYLKLKKSGSDYVTGIDPDNYKQSAADAIYVSEQNNATQIAIDVDNGRSDVNIDNLPFDTYTVTEVSEIPGWIATTKNQNIPLSPGTSTSMTATLTNTANTQPLTIDKQYIYPDGSAIAEAGDPLYTRFITFGVKKKDTTDYVAVEPVNMLEGTYKIYSGSDTVDDTYDVYTDTVKEDPNAMPKIYLETSIDSSTLTIYEKLNNQKSRRLGSDLYISHITVRAIDGNGNPIPGMRVQMYDSALNPIGDLSQPDGTYKTTGADGIVSYELDPGTYYYKIAAASIPWNNVSFKKIVIGNNGEIAEYQTDEGAVLSSRATSRSITYEGSTISETATMHRFYFSAKLDTEYSYYSNGKQIKFMLKQLDDGSYIVSKPTYKYIHLGYNTNSATVTDLPQNDYTVEEYVHPYVNQYLGSRGLTTAQRKNVTVGADGGAVAQFTNYVLAGRIVIKKESWDGNVDNITFQLTGTISIGNEKETVVNRTVYTKAQSGGYGSAWADKLPVAWYIGGGRFAVITYKVEEITPDAYAGFYTTDDDQSVSFITKNDFTQQQTLDFDNGPAPGKLLVYKYTESRVRTESDTKYDQYISTAGLRFKVESDLPEELEEKLDEYGFKRLRKGDGADGYYKTYESPDNSVNYSAFSLTGLPVSYFAKNPETGVWEEKVINYTISEIESEGVTDSYILPDPITVQLKKPVVINGYLPEIKIDGWEGYTKDYRDKNGYAPSPDYNDDGSPGELILKNIGDGVSFPTDHGTSYMVTTDEAVFTNTRKKGSIRLNKADQQTMDALSGAEFSLYYDANGNKKIDNDESRAVVKTTLLNENDNPVIDEETNEFKTTTTMTLFESNVTKGLYFLNDIPYGDYILKETKTPDNSYVNEAKEYAFSITDDKQDIQIVEDTTTDNDGNITVTGYRAVDITNTGFIDDGKVYNQPIIGSITLKKVDADDPTKKLSGAIFRVYKDADGDGSLNSSVDEILGDMTELTDAQGKGTGEYIYENLRYGTYFVREMKAPEGYLATITTKKAEVTTNGQVIDLGDIENREIKGNVKVTKLHEAANSNELEELDGVEFTVYVDTDKDGIYTENVDTVYGILGKIQGTTGQYELRDIPYGKYILKETKTAEGHKLSDKIYPFSILDDGKTLDIKDDGQNGIINDWIKGDISVLKVDKANQKPLAGAEFTLYRSDDTVVDKKTTGADGKAEFSEVKYGDYYVKETKAPKDYVINPNKFDFKVSSDGAIYNETVEEDHEQGKLEIIKISEDGKVDGITFYITGDFDGSGVTTRTFSTDSQGKINTGDIRTGTYTVKEAVDERYLPQEDKTVTVTVGATASVSFENVLKKGNVEVTKIDEEYPDNKLEGAEFTVYKNEVEYGKLIEVTSGDYLLTDIPYGDYTLKETKAPRGFKLDTNTYAFSIRENGITVPVETDAGKGFLDEPIKGNISVYKIDGATRQPLADAEFTLFKGDSSVVATATTGADGTVFFENVRYGDYYVMETKAPKDYVLNPNRFDFEVRDDGVEYPATVEEDHEVGNIELTKTSEDGIIEGITFYITGDFDGTGEATRTFTTDANGKINTGNIRTGTYTVREAATDRYLPQEDKTVTVTVGATATVSFDNKLKKGNIQIIKVDDEDNAVKLSGAEFTVYKQSDDTVVATTVEVKDKEGKGTGEYKLAENIPYGDYYVVETVAPPTYVRDENQYPFSIRTDGETVPVENKFGVGFENTHIVGKIKVVKVDSKTTAPLSGAEFTLYKADGTKVRSLTTGTTGDVNFSGLRVGDYYIVETKAPADHILDATPHYFSVTVEQPDVVTHTKTNAPEEGDIELIKTSEDGIVEGITFSVTGNFDGSGVTTRTYTTDAEGKFNTGRINTGSYVIEEAPDARYNAQPAQTIQVTKDATARVSFENTLRPIPFELTKSDISTGALIPDCWFRIRDDQGNIIVEDKTDENGIARFTLHYGKYTYQEYDAPEGYIIDDKEYEFTINPDDTIKKAEMKNTGTGTIEITKLDISTGALIPDTSFRIKNADGSIVVEGKTDENGVAKFVLPYGKYTYQEYDAPDGYIIDDTEYPFEIKENGEIVPAEMKNTGTGTIEITKLDISTGALIPGTSFRIKDADGNVVVEGVTNDKGIASFTLPYGSYTYQEYDAPEGYIIDTAEYPFEIKQNGEIVKAEMTNVGTGSVEITKADVTTGAVIPDCGIEILDENKNTLFRGKTDKDGKVTFADLPYGKYFYREYDAPDGYILDETAFPFEITENGQIIKAEMTNRPETDQKPDSPIPGETPDEPIPGEIPDEPVPGDTSFEPTPGYIEKTGDNTNVTAYAAVIGISLLAIAFALFRKKKDSK